MLTFEVVLLALSFLAVLLAVRKGDTWNADRRGIKKVTRYGWVAIGIASAVFVVGVAKQIYQARLAQRRDAELQYTYKALETATIRYEALRTATLISFDKMKERLETTFHDAKVNLKLPLIDLGSARMSVPQATIDSMKEGLDDTKNHVLEVIESVRRDYLALTAPAFGPAPGALEAERSNPRSVKSPKR